MVKRSNYKNGNEFYEKQECAYTSLEVRFRI